LHALVKITVFRQVRQRQRRGIFVVTNHHPSLAPAGAASLDVAPDGAWKAGLLGATKMSRRWRWGHRFVARGWQGKVCAGQSPVGLADGN
jgi:hypothetical protein